VVILLFGAELNSEMEHQTARDTTTGPEKPMGTRGATMADTVGESRHSAKAKAKQQAAGREPMRSAEQQGQGHDQQNMRLEVDREPSRAATLAAIALPMAALLAGLFRRRRDAGAAGKDRRV
jgi:hypothetical protein